MVKAPGRPLHELSTDELLDVLQAADAEAVAASREVAPSLARAIEALVARWPAGGRLIYVGAGTSGRIGALDAAECGPTFGVPADRVLAIIAGGERALAQPVEAAEDSESDGVEAVAERDVGGHDLVVGLSASGSTPFTCAAVEASSRRGAETVAITCASGSRLAGSAAIAIVLPLGAEVIEGSTRMKAGTAQKLVCNALSTAAFIRLGRVWDRHMVAVRTSSDKLRRRAVSILRHLDACADDTAAQELLRDAGDDLPTALVMALAGAPRDAAVALLNRAHGDVHRALLLADESR